MGPVIVVKCSRFLHFLLVWQLLGQSSGVIASLPAEVRIASHHLPPYHWLENEARLVGPARDRLACIFEKLSIPWQVDVFPWARAQHVGKEQQYDGFFIASKNGERDVYATISAPFLFDQWNFYYNPGRVFDSKAQDLTGRTVGVLLGSNMELWLEKKAFQYISSAVDYDKHFQMLKLERLDIVMATSQIYLAEMEKKGWPTGSFVEEPIRNLKLGVYFGHHFLEAYPEFLPAFNARVTECLML